ncbi:ATP-dependent zinc metalloprotease FtsH [Thermodesulfobacterium sp. TA1]|uniref:ATP-dependent zinc metalloprotease FtsH n=1 Tax=Thermodesulfobacterium sp. TA1 TaxID=2234087 RepID=UPI001231F5EE|nr:ATP-dependent zinc metalloprotease FtsH [Thermodesulfobacterium sp. TA1]QER41938.1 ATP-dependent zinc metalloprotease FtsH [Thermodesulfobacterium sp. TA1]
MKGAHKLTLILFSVFILLVSLVALEKFYPKYELLTYSEFKTLVKFGLVDNLTLKRFEITGEFRPQAAEKLYELRNKPVKISGFFKVYRTEDPDLIKLLEEKGIRYQAKPESNHWVSLLSWFIPLIILIGFWLFLFKKFTSSDGGIISFGKSKAKIYVENEIQVTFKDVAGVDEAVEELKEIIEFLKNPEKFTKLGAKIPKGVLLVGPPGTGKTLLARAVAGEAGVPFISISGSSFVEMFVGVGAARVRDLFFQAEKMAPCIIFIDEIDAVGRVRGVSPAGGTEEREHTLTQLLTEMDGFDPKKGVIIIAATNRPEILDPALLRPGRFDRVVVVDRPDLKGREEILKLHCQNIPLGKDVDLKVIAARTPGMVGADLANVVNEAALLAARKGKSVVEMEDFEEAIDRVIAGLAKKNRYISHEEKTRIAYHEAGHAVVASILTPQEKVHRISIIPRGVSALGYTLQLPTEERYLMTKTELLSKISVLLAGRAAEELIFKEVSTGAQNDLERATEIARAMVMDYGMSEILGPQTFRKREHLFLDVPFKERELVSEEIAALIDQEISHILKTCYETSAKILSEKMAILETIVKILMEKEVLEGEELERLLYQNLQGGTPQ